MIYRDAIVVGGGPAGSTCAWKLRSAGLDVVVVDRAVFPRDKVCGGWITPQVVADLQLDVDDYRRGRTFQSITGFRTGTIGGARDIDTLYGRPVSFGIRRCEFDDYLLRRSGAAVRSGMPIERIRRDGLRWIVNDAITAPMLVGAGGHFCPVARMLNREAPGGQGDDEGSLVVAQEVECAVPPGAAAAFTTAGDRPELYFCRDLKGYGWCFRKGDYVNIGFGRADRRSLPAATAAFVAFLERRGTIPRGRSWPWRGHAYLLHDPPRRRLADAGVVLVGDAAGLAYPQSGEGIRPAVESGLLAALTILEADGCYTPERLAPYERRLRERLGRGPRGSAASRLLSPGAWARLGDALLSTPAFVRHVALDRWFLHAGQPPLPVWASVAAIAGPAR